MELMFYDASSFSQILNWSLNADCIATDMFNNSNGSLS
jgi:hypothetical protein